MNAKRTSQDIIEIRRMTWMRHLVIGGALVASLAISGAKAQESNPGSFFNSNPWFVGTRTSLDPFDPFAPVAFGASAVTTAHKFGFPAESARSSTELALPPLPGLPGEPF